MPKIPLGAAVAVAWTFSFLLIAAPPAQATVNYGDFFGASIDFLQVSETTQTADPEPLWDAPAVAGTGDALEFFPSAFISSCAAGSSDTTESILTTTLQVQAGAPPFTQIETVTLMEFGDVTLTKFAPFGSPATNATAAATGTVTVKEVDGVPVPDVVIPFSGTFTPSATFALPTNFDTSLWTGTIDVDVASVVPNATKVDVSITSTLESNCEPGASSGKIQKKVVSGPGVALMVNAPDCAVDLDKQCCVPQPVLPDLDICEGEVVSLSLEFTGDSCKASNNDQGRAFKCFGRRNIKEPADLWVLDYTGTTVATPDTDLLFGDVVTITNTTGTLNDKTKLKVKGDYWRKQYLKIDTSCNRALECGDQFGAFKLVGLESTEGGVVDCSAPPPPDECRPPGFPPGTPCDAKLVDLVLEYNGQDCQDPLGNPQNGEASCSGDATGVGNVGVIYTGKFGYKQQISPSSLINDGDRIRVTATWHGGLFPNQKYLITDVDGNAVQEIAFHVSCSQPLALGDEFGSFKVVGFTTKSGFNGELSAPGDGWEDACEVPLAPPGPHCTSDLQELTLVYIGDFLGEGCTLSNPQKGYAYCNGVDDPGDPVSVTTGTGLVAAPEDQIEFGDLMSITADAGGDLPSSVDLWTTGAGGTQDIHIKTSCYKPLSLGDRFGSWVVFGMDRQDEGPISLGGNILYRYTATNPGPATIDNVTITDDQLGEIVSGVELAPAESQEFIAPATLFGTTTNVATATATDQASGGVCEVGQDQVTVTVTAPPPGSFYCSAPIKGYTMIWNGAQTVDVKAWSGVPGTGGTVLVAEFVDVEPGMAIEVNGVVTANHPVWKIYEAGTTDLIGTSSFNYSCKDRSMNGIEDCGKNQGNGKYDDPSLNNDWLLEGLEDSDETLTCTPEPVPQAPSCGLGPELLFLMPGLMWLHRRRLGRKD